MCWLGFPPPAWSSGRTVLLAPSPGGPGAGEACVAAQGGVRLREQSGESSAHLLAGTCWTAAAHTPLPAGHRALLKGQRWLSRAPAHPAPSGCASGEVSTARAAKVRGRLEQRHLPEGMDWVSKEALKAWAGSGPEA